MFCRIDAQKINDFDRFMQELKEKAARVGVDQAGLNWARKQSHYIRLLTRIFKEEYGEREWTEVSGEEAEEED